MRCTIIYRWGRFSGGSEDFGVCNEQDPCVAIRRSRLERQGMHIVEVRFY